MSLKKTLVGLTPIRASDIDSTAMVEAAPDLGGLVEFLSQSGAHALDSDRNQCAELSASRSGPVADASLGGLKAVLRRTRVMSRIASDQDDLLGRLAQDPEIVRCAPQLSEPVDPSVWLERPGAPARLARRGRTGRDGKVRGTLKKLGVGDMAAGRPTL